MTALARALLLLWPRLLAPSPAALAAVEHAASQHAVPVEVLAAVCWQESRLGTAPRYASLCGVRLRHAYVRDDVRSADIAARSLAGYHARCRSWTQAVAAYRVDGRCGAPAGLRYARGVVGLAGRLRRALDAPPRR